MTIYKILFSTFLLLLCGCSPRGESGASRSGDRVSVSIHGVNYTEDPFEFSVVDPRDEKNNGGGEHIGPYAAGGIVCCFKLPAKWSPGTVIEVESRHWLSTGNGEEISAIEKKHTVELPAYANGKAGELWVLRRSDGGIDIVSSDLQPDHPQWPGNIKDWPVPSREFMLERWELERKLAELNVRVYQESTAELNRSPSLSFNWHGFRTRDTLWMKLRDFLDQTILHIFDMSRKFMLRVCIDQNTVLSKS